MFAWFNVISVYKVIIYLMTVPLQSVMHELDEYAAVTIVTDTKSL